MNKQNLELARRVVACDHWRWMAGTPAVAEFHGEKVGLVCIYANHQHMADFYCLDYDEVWENIHVSDQRSMGMLPNLDNPATLGCLLHLVREAWGDPLARVERTNRFYTYDDRGTGCSARAWVVHIKTPPRLTRIPADTEIEALVNALEAADE